ncbi:hypothetical protein ACQKNX_03395 [Lysinibacillus sp. NPDC093712]|uniref:hypothetical protein n=1 Tax=Lysinibacillus sp. NPDC093712 TaxID=3390579 RepID=UPI003D03B03C
MKDYIIIIISILLLFTIFFIVQRTYTIPSNVSAITASIQQHLEEEISSIKEYVISQSNSKIVIFEYGNNMGYAVFKENYFNKKLKIIFVKTNILEKNINIIHTNRGNYILLSGNYHEKIDYIVVKEGNTNHLFEVTLINENIGNLYITLETIPRKLTDTMLDDLTLYNEDNKQVH